MSSWSAASLNKLEVLKKAIALEIKIPDSKIITSLNSNIKSDGYISKAAYENYRYSENGLVYMQHVDSVTNILHDVKRSDFAPSYVQIKIDSFLEARTFYFENEFFSMASKSLSGKDIDIRNTTSGIMRFPYVLPQAYWESLHQLMGILFLNIGSIDTIIDTNGTCYFLEINPNGSFFLLSQICDYNIESKLTNYLTD